MPEILQGRFGFIHGNALVWTSEDRAHLQRWSDDDRADEEWQTIDRFAQEHRLLLPPNVFITEILATRRVAKAIACRGKYRDLYHAYAKQMDEVAQFLREPHPAGMPPTLPESEELARMLEDAAEGLSHGSRSIPGRAPCRESNPQSLTRLPSSRIR